MVFFWPKKRAHAWIYDYPVNIYEFELLEHTIRAYRRRKRKAVMAALAPIFAILPQPIAEELADCSAPLEFFARKI